MIANAVGQDYAVLQVAANVVFAGAALGLLIWALVRALSDGAEQLDRDGFWERRDARRGKRHHGPLPLPDRKPGPSGLE